MIKIKNLTKTYQVKKKPKSFLDKLFPKQVPLLALNKINLEIKRGEIFGLLGPNGAGKTTLIQILCGLLQPSGGEVFIDGEVIEKNKKRIGLMLGSTMIYYRLTGYDNLEYFARIYNVKNYKKKIHELAKLLGLENWLYEYVEKYSEGMKTKLALARTLIHNPDIILLDEPTLGLDPCISIEIREKILQLKQQGKTIILTTHYMEEAEYLSDRIGILNHGKLVVVNTTRNLKKLIGKKKATLSDVFIKLTGEKL
jgi:ABC-2 type transport system ATP-binding protein